MGSGYELNSNNLGLGVGGLRSDHQSCAQSAPQSDHRNMASLEAFLQVVAGLVGQVLDLTELRALLVREPLQASWLHLILARHLLQDRVCVDFVQSLRIRRISRSFVIEFRRESWDRFRLCKGPEVTVLDSRKRSYRHGLISQLPDQDLIKPNSRQLKDLTF